MVYWPLDLQRLLESKDRGCVSFKYATETVTRRVLLRRQLGDFTRPPSLADGGQNLKDCNHFPLCKGRAGKAGRPEGHPHQVCSKSLGSELLHEEETPQSGKVTYRVVSLYSLSKLTE